MALTDEQKKHFINQKKKIALKNKEYYEKNKETILEKRKIKKQKNTTIETPVETPVETPIRPTTNKKQELNSKYYNLNKQTILENKKKKLECKFCKSLVSKNDITRHYKSIKCMKMQEFVDLDLD